MKRTFKVAFAAVLAMMIALLSFGAYAVDTTACEINEIKMSISVPNDMLFITRESKETDSYFAKFKLDYDQIMENFEEGNIYLQAMKSDKSITMTVSSEVNDGSREADNFNKLSDEKLAKIKAEYLSGKNVAYKSGSVVEYNCIKYICFIEKGDTGCDYNTVVNGRDYHIHFGVKKGAKVTSADKELFDSIIKGTSIIEDNFINNNYNILLYGGVTLFGLILVAVVVVVIMKKSKKSRTNRRHSHLVHELAHEHKISETTKIPRKTIADITEPTMTFLKNYEPIEEIGGKTEEKAQENKTEPAKRDTATYISVPFDGSSAEKDDNMDEINAIAAEAKQAAAQERAKKMKQEAVELPKPDYEELTDEAELPEPETAESAEESFDNAKDYFDDEDTNIYSSRKIEMPETHQTQPETSVEETVAEQQDEVEHYDVVDENDDPEYYEEEEVYESHVAENAKRFFGAVGNGLARFFKALGRGLIKFFKALGRGIASVAGTIWTVIIYLVVHCRYFCINLSRAIKRKRNIKKRQKAQQQRQEQANQQHRDELAQRRAQRDAEMARRRANAQRGDNDLVQVHSREEHRPPRPAQRPSDRTAYPRNRRR